VHSTSGNPLIVSGPEASTNVMLLCIVVCSVYREHFVIKVFVVLMAVLCGLYIHDMCRVYI